MKSLILSKLSKIFILQSNYRFSSTNSLPKGTINDISDIIGYANVIDNTSDKFGKYTKDWTGSFQGGNLVCLPKNTVDVSRLLRYCSDNYISVVPQGGNTGLCGGCVGINDMSLSKPQIILSLEKMNRIISVNHNANALICEAGCTLQSLNDYVEQFDNIVPLDLGAKGSCMIGGNISTNAGGLRVLRYGSIGKSVLGLEVVLADGTILDMLSTLLKDNNGYNLNTLFIGSEGTLGIITKVSIKLAPKPTSVSVMLAKVSSFSDVAKLLSLSRKHLGETLSAFEYIDVASAQVLQTTAKDVIASLPNALLPVNKKGDSLGIEGEVLVLIECSSSGGDLKRTEAFQEMVIDSGLVTEAILSSSASDEQRIWAVRELVPVALMQASRLVNKDKLRLGKLFKYDVSIDLDQVNNIIHTVKVSLAKLGYLVENSAFEVLNKNRRLLGYRFLVCTFGHAGDSNIHLNILLVGNEDCAPLSDADIEAVYDDMDRIVYNEVIALDGSISAEHGIGQLKVPYMMKSRSHAEVAVMRAMKYTLDKNGILNPGKVLPI